MTFPDAPHLRKAQTDRLDRIAARMAAEGMPQDRIDRLYANAPAVPHLFASYVRGAKAALKAARRATPAIPVEYPEFLLFNELNG